jgi:Mn-dependent DtxR family transcriptional regulator
MSKYHKVTPDQVFSLMCNTTVCIMNYYTNLIPTTAMAERLETSRYRIRKCLKELEAKGYVKSGYECCYSDWLEQYRVVRGFYVTIEGQNTETYKEAERKERELIHDVFDC